MSTNYHVYCCIDLYRNRSISRQGPRTVWEEIDARASRRGSLLVMMCRALRTRHFPSPCFSLLVRLSSRPSAPLPLCSWQETGVLATGDWRALLPLARLECLRLHVPSRSISNARLSPQLRSQRGLGEKNRTDADDGLLSFYLFRCR